MYNVAVLTISYTQATTTCNIHDKAENINMLMSTSVPEFKVPTAEVLHNAPYRVKIYMTDQTEIFTDRIRESGNAIISVHTSVSTLVF